MIHVSDDGFSVGTQKNNCDLSLDFQQLARQHDPTGVKITGSGIVNRFITEIVSPFPDFNNWIIKKKT